LSRPFAHQEPEPDVTRTLLALCALTLATVALAAKTPEKIDFETRGGVVSFPHKLHAARGCKPCHEAAPAKFPGFNKDKAHALCKGCHETLAKGPMKCEGCHRR
jgi:predicted CXXCH cytochrome family protein